jgi:hypothetical protein
LMTKGLRALKGSGVGLVGCTTLIAPP